MSFIDATTGHSPREERNIAKLLYIALAAAVVLGMAFFFILGQKKSLDPTIRTEPAVEAPTPSEKL